MAALTQLSDFVRDTRLPGVVDQVTVQSPFWMDLWKNKKLAGGGALTGGIRYQGHRRTQAGGEYSDAKVVKRDVITSWSLSLADIMEPVEVSMSRLRKINSGANKATQLTNYMNEQSQAAEDSLVEHLGASVFSDGTPTVNDAGDSLPNLTGLKAICTRDATYGGVAVANAPTWNPFHLNTASATGGTFAGITFTGTPPTLSDLMTSTSVFYFPHLLSRCITGASFGNDKPTMILMGEVAYEIFKRIMFANQRYETDLGRGGFKAIWFEGVPVVLDKKTSPGWVFGVTMKYLGIGAVPGAEVSFDAFRRVTSDVLQGLYLFSGQMFCESRRHQFAISGLPTTLA